MEVWIFNFHLQAQFYLLVGSDPHDNAVFPTSTCTFLGCDFFFKWCGALHTESRSLWLALLTSVLLHSLCNPESFSRWKLSKIKRDLRLQPRGSCLQQLGAYQRCAQWKGCLR